jgi:hypothetical protein
MEARPGIADGNVIAHAFLAPLSIAPNPSSVTAPLFGRPFTRAH